MAGRQAFGASGETVVDGSAAGVDQGVGGFLVGADGTPSASRGEQVSWLGMTAPRWTWSSGRLGADVDGVRVGVYRRGAMGWIWDGPRARPYAWRDLATTRAQHVPGFDP